MWSGGFPFWQVALAAAVVNVRYFLLTAAVAPLLQPFGRFGSAWRVHFVTDENWAVTMAESRGRQVTGDFFVGGWVCVGLFWFFSVLAGHGLGFSIAAPERFGLDFAFTALFTALAVTMRLGRKDIFPWAVSAAVAFAAFRMLPGREQGRRRSRRFPPAGEERYSPTNPLTVPGRRYSRRGLPVPRPSPW